ncbi:hypothetical protein PHMEG_0005739 [Phytophthora megakarya]|uniref:Uncharacterized protein n=1 Tax=Phytophthora megakarya TaxID=4795 RepID=A0A225WQF0_9STRA|nr:hypothetical protein PHMEG_0005739 [Phytophthora megakarya]
MEDDAVNTSGEGIFSLYQEGLTSDQVLQLCFLRRRATRRLHLERTRIEDEFVLPRPELKIANLLPPADIPLEQLISITSPPSIQASNSDSPTDSAIDSARDSARKHFMQPTQAPIEEVRGWSALTERDWLLIQQSTQQPKKQRSDDEMTDIDAQVPGIADVCCILERCRSDAYVSFVWDHLLIALLQQCVGSDALLHERLLALLVSHHSFASLIPKDFRAKVRSRNLRQVDDAFGAQVELALVALYRNQRGNFKCDKFP